MTFYMWMCLVLSLFAIAPAQALDCRAASPGAEQWKNEGFPDQRGKFSVSFRAIPRGSDVLIGLSNGARSTWTGLAAIVRFHNNMIDVRNGGVYMSDTPTAYEFNESVNVRMDVDTPRRRYSVFVSRTGQSEVQIANDYAFRTEQQAVTVLNNSVIEAEVGTLEACMLTFKIRECDTATAGVAQWQNRALPSIDYGDYPVSVEFDATPLGPPSQTVDALIGLSKGPQRTWSGLAAIARFSREGIIDARNGDRYAHDWYASYSPGSPIHFRLDVDPFAHLYSVVIYNPGSINPIRIAHNYRFRTEQQQVSPLNNVVTEAEVGGLQVCNAEVRYGY